MEVVGDIRVVPAASADFFTVALDDPSIAGAASGSLLSHIVFSAERTAVRDVAVAGELVVRDGFHPLADEIVREFTRVQGSYGTNRPGL